MEVTVHMCLIQLPDAFMKLNCHDLKKKKEPKLPVQKVYEVRLCLVQKISTWYKSTFFLFHDTRQVWNLEKPKGAVSVYRVNVGPGTKKMQFLPTKRTL